MGFLEKVVEHCSKGFGSYEIRFYIELDDYEVSLSETSCIKERIQ
jgi:hypothetical protein